MPDYIPYIVTDCFCALYAVSTLTHLNPSMGSEREVHRLRNMILSYIVFVGSMIVWAVCEGGLISIPLVPNLIVNAVSILSLTLGCYFWFLFVQARLHPDRGHSRVLRFLAFAPALVICVLDAASVFTGWMFTVDGNGHYSETDAFVIQTAVNFAYLLIPTLEFIIQAFRTESKEHRREYVTYAVYMIIPLACGAFLEEAFPTVPVLELSIFLMIHIFFITIQNLQVQNDALTGLNNRHRLEIYLRGVLPEASEKKPVYFAMLDVDFFKMVNDTYGHAEGDRMLRGVARAIKRAAGEHGAFAARYGGDEFCIVSNTDPEEIRASIDRAVEEEPGDFPCEVSISMGSTECRAPERDLAAVIKRADARLYEEKKRKHALR